MTFSSGVADCDLSSHTLLSNVKTTVAKNALPIPKTSYLEPVLSLSALGYCRNMVGQHGQ